jgi:hypothetical protein
VADPIVQAILSIRAAAIREGVRLTDKGEAAFTELQRRARIEARRDALLRDRLLSEEHWIEANGEHRVGFRSSGNVAPELFRDRDYWTAADMALDAIGAPKEVPNAHR